MYRYHACGTFTGVDKEIYDIDIPSPKTYKTEEEVLRDESFGYRFVVIDDRGPQIVIFEKEELLESTDGQTIVYQDRVSGDPVAIYSYDVFINKGGKLRILKPEKRNCGYIDSETDFLDTNKTFKDIFCGAIPYKFYYIDHEAYWIEEL